MRYVFSEIPNNEEGRQLVSLMRKYLNRNDYTLLQRGQFLQDGEDWRQHTHGQSLAKSKCIRVYIDRIEKSEPIPQAPVQVSPEEEPELPWFYQDLLEKMLRMFHEDRSQIQTISAAFNFMSDRIDTLEEKVEHLSDNVH